MPVGDKQHRIRELLTVLIRPDNRRVRVCLVPSPTGIVGGMAWGVVACLGDGNGLGRLVHRGQRLARDAGVDPIADYGWEIVRVSLAVGARKRIPVRGR